MNDKEDKINLEKNVLDDNSQKKIVDLFGTDLFQIFNCVFVPTFRDFVDYNWLLLEKSSLNILWRIHCLGGTSV